MNNVEADGADCLKIELACGTVYGLPVEKIWQDFMRCVMVVNEVNEDEARAVIQDRKVSDPDHWKAWFNEQYTVDDVIEDGFLISLPSQERVQELARFYRSANSEMKFLK